MTTFWEEMFGGPNPRITIDDLIGQTFYVHIPPGQNHAGPEPDYFISPDGKTYANRNEWKREQFGQHYGAGPNFFRDSQERAQQYHAREEEYQRQRRENDPGQSGDLPHGYHDKMRNITWIKWQEWNNWVDDEALARAKCWRCLIGNPHFKDMCEKWKFPDPVHYDMGFNTKHNYKMAYSYDLVIPEDVLDLGTEEDGAFVITSLDKVIGTDIALI